MPKYHPTDEVFTPKKQAFSIVHRHCGRDARATFRSSAGFQPVYSYSNVYRSATCRC